MNDISGFGLTVVVRASNTFPVGAPITQFADDGDPFDLPELTIAETAMGLNGDLITWSSAVPIQLVLNVIPDGLDDIALNVIGEANRVGRGKQSARDIITIVGVYPNGRTVTLSGGKMTNYMPSTGVASSGRFKTKKYNFMFESVVVTPPLSI